MHTLVSYNAISYIDTTYTIKHYEIRGLYHLGTPDYTSCTAMHSSTTTTMRMRRPGGESPSTSDGAESQPTRPGVIRLSRNIPDLRPLLVSILHLYTLLRVFRTCNATVFELAPRPFGAGASSLSSFEHGIQSPYPYSSAHPDASPG